MTDREVTIKFSGNSSGATKAASDTAQALDKMASSAEDTQSSIKTLATAIGLTEDETAALVAATREAVEKTSGLNASAREVARSMGLSEQETRQFVRQLKAADSAAEGLADATDETARSTQFLADAAATAIAAFGVREVVQFGRELLQVGVQMEAAERRSDTVFGNMAEDAREWAEANDQAFGTSTGQTLAMLSAVGDLIVPMGFTREAAFEMSKEILNTANAMSEWTGGSIDTLAAQEKITKALLDERDGLVDLGIKISEADIKRELARRGTEDLTDAALAQEKALITLELIQLRGADALTAYADGANEAQAAQKELNTEWGNFKEQLADEFSDELVDGVDKSITAVELLGDEVDRVTDPGTYHLVDLERDFGFFADRITGTREVVDNLSKSTSDLADTLDASERRGRNAERMHRDTAEAVSIVRQDTEGYTRSLYDLLTANAELASPALAAAGAIDRLKDSQQDAADAAQAVADAEKALADADTKKERVAAQEDLVAAQEAVSDSALDLAGAQLQLDTALARLRTEGGADSIAAFEEVLRTAGATEDQIRELMALFLEYNALQVTPKTVGIVRSDGTRVSTRQGQNQARAGGGPASGRTLVGEAGPELVDLPRGSFVNSASATRAMTGAGMTVHIHINATMDLTNPSSMRDIARRLKAELEDLWRGES